MPASGRYSTLQTIQPSKIVKVTAFEMIQIMKRNSSSSFIPATLHNGAAGVPVLTQCI